MLFNCAICGKAISSKRDTCVYCKADQSQFAAQFNAARAKSASLKPLKTILQEKYPGMIMALLARIKAK